MSKSLVARLRRRHGRPAEGPTRRELLRMSLAAGAALLLSRSGARAGPKDRRVLVVGAGFAGLAAAHELHAAGCDVTLVEARRRVGGRVLSFRDLVPERTVEGGAELIGSNHPAWVAYAETFGLSFLDVSEEEDLEAPILLGGKRLSAEESGALWEGLDAALASMNADAAKVDATAPWSSPGAAALDRRTTASWIDAQDVRPLTKRAMHALLASDNGVETAWQSYLGNLAQVKGGGVEKYWEESEVYRCKGGNDQLARKLAGTLPEKRVRLGVPVASVRVGERAVTATLADGTAFEADDLVLAVPPSVWRRIAFDPPLPAALTPQMGSNVKYLLHVRRRFWLEGKLSQYSLTDGPVSQTWEGTDAQPDGKGACLTAFSGGEASEACRGWPAGERDGAYARELERVYEGVRGQVVAARFMDWPGDPWTRASYSFPAPGQVTTVGPLLQEPCHGRLHFAGEHCCYAFVGYMEGALQSGAAVAKRLAAA